MWKMSKIYENNDNSVFMKLWVYGIGGSPTLHIFTIVNVISRHLKDTHLKTGWKTKFYFFLRTNDQNMCDVNSHCRTKNVQSV